MAPTDSQKGRTALPRRNTFQKMLDLERKNKVDRMQASTPPIQPTPLQPTPRGRRSSAIKGHDSHLEGHPALLATQGRAMTTPALSLAIPHTNRTADSSAKNHAVKAGNVVPQSEDDNGNESERSSICHSPGWDDLTGNRKKKEKQAAKNKQKAEIKKLETDVKKAENKKLETDAKHAARTKHRLSKPPPTHHRFSNLGMSNRSASFPILSTMTDSSQASPAQEQRPKEVTRSRRSSFDAGLKNLFSATQSIPSLFSRHSHSRTPSTKTRETPTPSISSGNGFIGGLKLRLSEDAQGQEKIRQSATKDDRSPISDQYTQKENSGDSALRVLRRKAVAGKSTDKVHEMKDVPSHKPESAAINDESVRTPQQWDNIYAQAGKMVRDEGKEKPLPPIAVSEDNSQASKMARDEGKAKQSPSIAVSDDNWPPIMQRNIRSGGQAGRVMFPAIPNETRKHKSSGSSVASIHSRPRTSEEVPNYSRRESSPRSLDRNPRNREPSVDSRTGRTSGVYVQNQRLLSKDRGMAALQDEYRDKRSTASPARQRSPSFRSVKSHANTDIPPKPPTIGINSSSNPPEEFANNYAFFSEFIPPPAIKLDNFSPSSDTQPRNHHRNGSRGLKDLKIEANSAFPKTPGPSPIASPVANSFVSSIFDTVDSRPTSKRGPSSPAIDGLSLTGPSSKAEIALGEVFTSGSTKRSPMASPSNPVPSRWRYSGDDSPDGGLGNSNGMQHTRNATDSSEEYSTLDEFSNVTTPMASRPHSQKEYFPPMSDLSSSKFPKVSTIAPRTVRAKRVPIMSGAIPYDSDLYGSNESWSRTAMPIDWTDDDHHRTPTGYQSPTESSVNIAAPPVIQSDPAESSTNVEPAKESKSASALQRQLSLSRSASTPELQDLSFLPALKHQALTKPPAQKDKGKTALRIGTQPASSRDPENNEVIKPRPISVPTPESKGSPLASPSVYLRDARMSLPSQRPHSKSPKQILSPGSSSSSKQLASPSSTPDPIAKMFVVCCSCKYFHDMPSKIYECMAKPDNVVEDKNLGISGVVSTSVKCPWCGHGMNTACCAGYAAVVYLREKLH